MSERSKTFGAGAILSALLIFTLTGVLGWLGIQASQVPTLEATFKSEVAHLNESIIVLTTTAKETNLALEAYTKYHAENLSRITESLITHKYKIDDLEGDIVNLKKIGKACNSHLTIHTHEEKDETR